MYKEENLMRAFKLKLDIEIKNNLLYFKKEIRDSITHIFGTFNNVITSIGFKCTSGKQIQFGKKDGQPFLIGAYRKKLQCVNLKIEIQGITGLEAYFIENQLYNKYIELKEDTEAIYDEVILDKIKEEDYELVRSTSIQGLGNNELEKDKFEE